MGFSDTESDVQRCADDLNNGNAVDAAYVLRHEMYDHPLEFSSFVDEVNRRSSFSKPDTIVYDRFGNVSIRDLISGREIPVGKSTGLPPTLPPIDIGGHL